MHTASERQGKKRGGRYHPVPSRGGNRRQPFDYEGNDDDPHRPSQSQSTIQLPWRRLSLAIVAAMAVIAAATVPRLREAIPLFGTSEAEDVSAAFCPEGYSLERHDDEGSHGDVCRDSKGGFECPSGCRQSAGSPWCQSVQKSTPCRAPPGRGEKHYNCDPFGGERGVCVKFSGGPHFKGVGRYKDSTCDGKCAGGGGWRGSSLWKKKKTPGACKDDWDCSLSGSCVSGKCVCDSWASGSDCSYLSFAPVDKARLGYLDESHSSWGGNAVRSEKDRMWHMFVSEIACGGDDLRSRRCGLDKWQTLSRVAHVTSEHVEGPYERRGTVSEPEHHNPTVKVSPVDGSWNLYSISGGSGPIEVTTSTDEGATWSDPIVVSTKQNPGPVLHSDGSMTMFYRGDDADLPAPTCSGEYVGRQVCPSPTAKCETVRDKSTGRAFDHTAEDPSVFVDHRGNYHMLMNALPYLCVPKLQQGGHAWSRDGIHWSEPRVGAFDTTVAFTDGSSMTCERRERPQMILDPDREGVPLALVSAVVNCPTKGLGSIYRGGSDCFTLVQPMRKE